LIHFVQNFVGEYAMKRRNVAKRQRNTRRKQRGAALVFALVAVIVISILTLATGRLVGGHLALEQKAEGYSRAINIAEAAANWQLNRMSRSKLPGDTTSIPGRLTYEEVNTWGEGAGGGPEPYFGTLPTADLGTAFDGNATVWVRSGAGGNSEGIGKWTSPEDAVIYALGQDPVTRISRGVKFRVKPVGLSDPYALFGVNGLNFDSTPSGGVADGGAASIIKGFIGSNGLVSSDAAILPIGGAYSLGCRLGPDATMSPAAGSWPAGWDFPRLLDAVQWPKIDQVIGFMYQGRSVADCATANDNTQIEVMSSESGNFSPLRESSGNIVTALTSTQFDRSILYQGQYRVIRLRASENAANGNLFYFSAIQMRPNDVLILDSRKFYDPSDTTPPAGYQHTIRILINNANVGSQTTVTNLAYFQADLPDQTAGEVTPEPFACFWYNNTAGVFNYQPAHPYAERFFEPGGANPLFRYQLDPTLRGIVYGVNSLSAPGNQAGDINISGKSGFTVKVRSLVGNHVNILGPVTIEWSFNQDSAIEDNKNPNMYVLYYSIYRRIFGEMSPDVDPRDLSDPGVQASPVYDYGR